MKAGLRLIAPVLAAALLAGAPGTGQARVMMTGMINPTTGFGLDVLAIASITVDDWFSTPGLWWITITNTAESESLVVARAYINMTINSDRFTNIVEGGRLDFIGGTSSFRTGYLKPGEGVVVDNKALSGTNAAMKGKWNDTFKDEVLRIGYLPEGTYTLKFSLEGRYTNGTSFTGDVDDIEATFEIRNPGPPELVTPETGADDVVTVPRFSWQEPSLSVFTLPKGAVKPQPNYTLTVWKMFDDTGNTLTQEQAIRRVPVWKRTGITTSFADFDPGSAREELVSGRRYCWQIQGFDGTGRYISSLNQGKSDISEFTVRFTGPTLNEPLFFFPLRFSWTPAQTSGGTVLYTVQIADNQSFSRAVTSRGQVTTSYSYPDDAAALLPGKTYYLRVQTTDTKGIPIGNPLTESFVIPTVEILPSAPENGVSVATLTPSFRWQGGTNVSVVTVFREDTRWRYVSGKIEGNEWAYDGDPLERGVTYSWQVAPANARGDIAGTASETMRFTTPAAAQVSLIAPVGQTLDTAFPAFAWNPVEGDGGAISYTIEITTEDGTAVYSETVPSAAFAYPRTAPALQYATRYLWKVKALKDGADYGEPSAGTWFITPFAASTGEVTYAEIETAIKQVIADYPEFSEFKDKVITGITEGGNPVTPSQFMELFAKYRIKSTSVK